MRYQYLLGGQVAVRGASHRALQRQLSHERRVLVNGGQRDEAGVRPASIVEADDAHLLGDADARLLVQAWAFIALRLPWCRSLFDGDGPPSTFTIRRCLRLTSVVWRLSRPKFLEIR